MTSSSGIYLPVAAFGTNEWPILIGWTFLPIAIYVFAMHRTERAAGCGWMILMVPFGWVALVVALLVANLGDRRDSDD